MTADLTDTKRLDLFLRRTDELRQEKLIQTGALSNAMRFSGRRDGQTILSVSKPEETMFRSFLLAFRLLIAQKEPVNVARVANLLGRQLADGPLRDDVIEARAKWAQVCRTGTVRLVIDGREFGPERTLMLYLNGRYFHSDGDARFELDSVGPMAEPLLRQQVNEILVAGVNYTRVLEWVVVTGRAHSLLHV